MLEIAIDGVLHIFFVVEQVPVHTLFEHQFFLLLYCVAAAQVAVQVLQVRRNRDVLHRHAPLDLTAVVLQLVRFKRSVRLIRTRKHVFACLYNS